MIGELWWHFSGIILVVVVSSLMTEVKYSQSRYLVIIVNLFGTILHELAHYIVALVFLAKPTGFSIIPSVSSYTVDKNGREISTSFTLGSVEFQATALNAFPVGIAPLFLVPCAYMIYKYWFLYFKLNLFSTLGMYLTVFMVMHNSIPSGTDIKATGYQFSVLLWFILLLLGCAVYIMLIH